MNVTSDRITGAFFCLFGLTMYLMVIPTQVETGESGNLAPDTIPNTMSIIIALSGLGLLVRPTDHKLPDARLFLRTALYVVSLVAGLYAMSAFGFSYVAPPLALLLMLLIGERRPLWIAAGVLGMPALIWFVIVQVLERGLP